MCEFENYVEFQSPHMTTFLGRRVFLAIYIGGNIYLFLMVICMGDACMVLWRSRFMGNLIMVHYIWIMTMYRCVKNKYYYETVKTISSEAQQ